MKLLFTFMVLLCFACTYGQSLTVQCGKQSIMINTEPATVQTRLFEADTLKLFIYPVVEDTLIAAMIVMPKHGDIHILKAKGKQRISIAGMRSLLQQKTIATGTKITFIIRGKAEYVFVMNVL